MKEQKRQMETEIIKEFNPLKGFLYGSAGKESAGNAEHLGLIPGLGRSPGEGKGCPLQYSGLENSKDLYSPWGLRLGHHWATFTSLHTVI